jgi:hypothetical protein
MIFDTILLDLDDTIHDRNRSLCKFVDLFILRYCDAFDLNVALVIWDKKGCSNPMDKENQNIAYVICNNEEIDLSDSKWKFELIERK